jgi:Transmembrane secretion effector
MQLINEIRRLRTNRPLSLLIGASALSSFGDWLYLTALPIIVYQVTRDAALVGLVAAARMLPFLLLSMPAGAIADRFDRRRILVVTETTRFVLMVAMTVSYLVGADLRIILAFALLANAAGTFAMPAQMAWIPQLAADEGELGVANATTATLDNAAGILGPAVAGLLALSGGLGIAFILNGITFAIVVIQLQGMPDAAPASTRGHDASAPARAPSVGWIEIARLARRRISLDAAVSFAAGSLGILPVLIALDHLGAGEAFAGFLGAAAGLGAVVGGVSAGLSAQRDLRRALALGTMLAASALVILAASSLPLVSIGAILVAVAALVMMDTLNVTTLQREMPPAWLGRAAGILHTSAAASLMLGSAIPPIVASLAGVAAALQLTTVVVVALAGASLTTWPTAIRRLASAAGPLRA